MAVEPIAVATMADHPELFPTIPVPSATAILFAKHNRMTRGDHRATGRCYASAVTARRVCGRNETDHGYQVRCFNLYQQGPRAAAHGIYGPLRVGGLHP